MRKLELFSKKRKTTRNKQVDSYVKQKFKNYQSENQKHKLDIKYINLKRGVKSLSNTILIIKNSKNCHEYSKNNKKSYEYYSEVVFAGLHQPSKDIEPLTLKILKKFLKRYKVHSLDLAVDFDWDKSVNNANRPLFETATRNYQQEEIKPNIRNEGSSLYLNNPDPSTGLLRILLYDKYKKQTLYHKEQIKPELKDWKRLEITIKTKARFFDWIERDGSNDGVAILNDITQKLGGRGIMGVSVEMMGKQIQKLNDLRRAIDFKAWARLEPTPKSPKTRAKK
ncbi:hypothetical protein BKH46_07380 [Helicobacter sp. 12S02634-8]|nr:hypothetical protein BKH46_07380 [Helicobacter sp. 12S02634-8]